MRTTHNSSIAAVGPFSQGCAGEVLPSPAFLLWATGALSSVELTSVYSRCEGLADDADADDQDSGDIAPGVDLDALELDPMDTDRISSPDEDLL